MVLMACQQSITMEPSGQLAALPCRISITNFIWSVQARLPTLFFTYLPTRLKRFKEYVTVGPTWSAEPTIPSFLEDTSWLCRQTVTHLHSISLPTSTSLNPGNIPHHTTQLTWPSLLEDGATTTVNGAALSVNHISVLEIQLLVLPLPLSPAICNTTVHSCQFPSSSMALLSIPTEEPKVLSMDLSQN